ncbi:Adenine nucleotide alpha hydrolase superfamily protein [Trifolium repens]|nr:Adenine nucleotide alpha hydrolase superfamily protein [Trifolium repens]
MQEKSFFYVVFNGEPYRVDMDLDNLKSNAHIIHGEFYYGALIQAWVEYHSSNNQLEIRLSPNSSKPILPNLSWHVDLSPILNETMYVGFSASSYNREYIAGWSFKLNGGGTDLCKACSSKGKKAMEELGGGVDQVRGGAEERRMKMKVMVAIDESDGSFYALNWVLDNLFNVMTSTCIGASSTHENEGMIFLVHVEPIFHNYVYPIGSTGAAFYPASAVVDSVKKGQQEQSAALLSRALQICKDKQIKAESVILNGDPREMICQAAEQMQVDLLIMGSRGLGRLKRAFLGSVSDYCAHHAKAPILIVKPPDEHHKKHS